MLSIIINIVTIIMGLIGFHIAYQARGWIIFIYYTELSNLMGLISSLLYLIKVGHATVFRYTVAVMLFMTFLISLFVLAPAQGGIRKLMFEGHCLYFHTLIPLLTLFSYVFLETHSSAFLVPVVLTLIYGCIMFYLNYINKVKGPYPFFEVHRLGYKKGVLWFFGLLALISALSLFVLLIAG